MLTLIYLNLFKTNTWESIVSTMCTQLVSPFLLKDLMKWKWLWKWHSLLTFETGSRNVSNRRWIEDNLLVSSMWALGDRKWSFQRESDWTTNIIHPSTRWVIIIFWQEDCHFVMCISAKSEFCQHVWEQLERDDLKANAHGLNETKLYTFECVFNCLTYCCTISRSFVEYQYSIDVFCVYEPL